MSRVFLGLLGLLALFTFLSIGAFILTGSAYPVLVRHGIFYVLIAVAPIDVFAFVIMLRAYRRSKLTLIGHRTLWTGLIAAGGLASGFLGMAGALSDAHAEGIGVILLLLMAVCPAGVSLLIVSRYLRGG